LASAEAARTAGHRHALRAGQGPVCDAYQADGEQLPSSER
jgi:hypothetical protein